MGIYYGAFNVTKREWFTGHEMEGGAKWQETIHGPPATGLVTLLHPASPTNPWRGRWIGDYVIVCSDAGLTWHEVADALMGTRTPYGDSDDEIPGWTNIGEPLRAFLVEQGDLPCATWVSADAEKCAHCSWPPKYHHKLLGVVLRPGDEDVK